MGSRMTPEIAVVIPTRGRETRLAFALDALAEQTLPLDRFEVVVVRDAASKGRSTPPPDGLRVRALTCPARSGPTTGRNIGWRATAAGMIAFTDDDCRPSSDWLQRLLDAVDENTFLQGRTEPDPDEVHLLRGFARSQTVIGLNPWFPTCNMAYPRSLLERLGGFDESYAFDGEDTDLALRAVGLGASCRYVDDARVWHAVFSRTAAGAIREALAKRSLPLLVAKHPAQRRHLYLRAFRSKSHALLCLGAAAGLLLRRRPGLAAAAFLPYAHYHLADALAPENRTPRWVVGAAMHLPARTLVDAVDVAGIARSAIAHRVVMA
jgi:GT2 family glycosyltransferase